MLARVLEPEVMDDPAEAIAYDAMDFSGVNQDFADLVIRHYAKVEGSILDVGTGTAHIPILLVQQRPRWKVKAIDLARSMLAVGAKNIEVAGLEESIELLVADAKQLSWPEQTFDVVCSNSLIHHIADPLSCFETMGHLVKPGGFVIVRDLFRPRSLMVVDTIVNHADGSEMDERQLKLFRDSLCAAFTVAEIEAIAAAAEFTGAKIYQSSERHWTLIYQKP